MTRVVIAPDSFKGTASAADAAAALAAGWRAVRPHDELVERPMADGGEGTLDAFASAVPGARRMPVTVRGPVSEPVETSWLLLPDGTGVVELASTSGITLLDPLEPLDAHSAGFGEAIAAALDAGVERLLLALGGSACSDGGTGALTVLGAWFLDASGAPVPLGNRGLAMLDRVDLSGLRPLPPGGAVILGDVTNPLLGGLGAAAVFGPQKGADAATVDVLEANLARLADLVPDAMQPLAAAPGAGAAGGTGFGLLALGRPDGRRRGARGRGRRPARGHRRRRPRDHGGGPLRRAVRGGQGAHGRGRHSPRDAGVPTALVAGAITAEPRGFAASVALADLAGSGAAAMAEPLRWLEAAGAELARATG